MKYHATYNLIEFLRPDSYWPQPYTVEQAFGVFAHLLASAGPWPRPTAITAMLSAKPSCIMSSVEPIVSLADLRRRFHYALLARGGSDVERWRRRNLLKAYSSIKVSFPHHLWKNLSQSEHETKKELDALFTAGGKLTAQLNECHRKAREVCGVRLKLDLDCHWCFELDYGFDGSVWHHTLAEQRQREPFLRTMRRAVETLALLRANKKVA